MLLQLLVILLQLLVILLQLLVILLQLLIVLLQLLVVLLLLLIVLLSTAAAIRDRKLVLAPGFDLQTLNLSLLTMYWHNFEALVKATAVTICLLSSSGTLEVPYATRMHYNPLGIKKKLAEFNLADFHNSPNRQNKFCTKYSSYMVLRLKWILQMWLALPKPAMFAHSSISRNTISKISIDYNSLL